MIASAVKSMDRFFRMVFAPRYTASDASEIKKHLYLSSIDPVIDVNVLKTLEIRKIITVEHQPLEHNLSNVDYLWIKAADIFDEDLLSRFEECHQFISEGVSKNHNVIIHCLAGVSRSATIVIAYLMIEDKMSFQEALHYVQKRRSIVCPNFGFQKQLKLFEKMGRKLDPMNGEFRQHLMHNLRYQVLKNRSWFGSKDESNGEIIEKYLKKRDALDAKIPPEKVYRSFRCKKCRTTLFTTLNVIKPEEVYPQPSICQSIYIEPLDWMVNTIGNDALGTINCPNCQFKLGHFNWNGNFCECPEHKDLSNSTLIKVDTKKVDMPIFHMSPKK